MKFTLDQIKTAHAKVKSGADFPAYIQEIKDMGVTRYETFVIDGHTEYHGNHEPIASSVRYAALHIADSSNKGQFLHDLKAHQQGKSDCFTFCKQSASHGIEKCNTMTCAYYDLDEKEILVEHIPSPK